MESSVVGSAMMSQQRWRRIWAWLSAASVVALLIAGCASGEDLEDQRGGNGDDAGDAGSGIDDANGADDADGTDDVDGANGSGDDVTDGDTGTDDTDVDGGSDDDCQFSEDCPDDQVCVRPDLDTPGQCQEIDDGGVEGDACEESADCATGLCIDGVCERPCEAFMDCLDGWGCSDEGLCEPPGCGHDGDCADDQWCAVSPDDGQLETVCLPDNGGEEAGDPCGDDDECLGRYCLEGVCTTPCVNDEHCQGGEICDEKGIETQGVSGAIDLCQPASLVTCESPDDCEPQDLTCNMPTYDGDAIDGASCGETNPGQADLGESCAGNHDCESNFCLPYDGGQSGECSVFCDEPGVHCGSGQVCLQGGDEFGLCLASCGNDSDCIGEDVCHFGLDPDEELVNYCDAPVGDGQVGDECDSDTDCKSGLCLTGTTTLECDFDAHCPDDLVCDYPPGPGDKVCQESSCSAVCETDGDCPAGQDLSECSHNIEMFLEGSPTPELVSACAWPG